MTRPRKRDRHLPARMYFKHGRYWYVAGGKWTALPPDLPSALVEYGRFISPPSGEMGKLIDRVMDQLAQKVRPSTMAQYRLVAKRLKDILKDFSPDQVRGKHIAAIKLHHGKTPNMANRMLSVLRSVFAYAVEWQLVDSNPCIGVKRHVERKRDRYITDHEFLAVKGCAGKRLAAIMDVAYLTGQRIGDVLKIRYADISDEGIYFEQEKTGARLLVRMSPELRAAIDRAKVAGGDNIRAITLFHTRGKPVSYFSVRDQFDTARKAAGVEDMHIHDIRAKSLTDTKRQGKDAQKLAGHTDAKMTARYIRLREVDQAEPPSFGQSKDGGVKKA